MAFFIIFKGLSLKKIKTTFLEGDRLALNSEKNTLQARDSIDTVRGKKLLEQIFFWNGGRKIRQPEKPRSTRI